MSGEMEGGNRRRRQFAPRTDPEDGNEPPAPVRGVLELHLPDPDLSGFGPSEVHYMKHNRNASAARVSLTLRLICGYLLRSLLPFLTCIYETLLDLQIYTPPRSCGWVRRGVWADLPLRVPGGEGPLPVLAAAGRKRGRCFERKEEIGSVLGFCFENGALFQRRKGRVVEKKGVSKKKAAAL